jgi:class 3 adenylate cyclase
VRTIITYLRTVLKSRHKSSILYICISVFLVLTLSNTENLLSRFSHEMYKLIHISKSNVPKITHIEVSPSEFSVSYQDLFHAVAFAYIHKASQIIILGNNLVEDSNDNSSTLLKRLLNGETLNLNEIITNDQEYKKNFIRMITEDERINYSVVISDENYNSRSVTTKQAEFAIPASKRKYYPIPGDKTLLEQSNSFIQNTNLDYLLVSANVSGSDLPNTAISTVKNFYNSNVINSWHGLLLKSDSNRIYIPYFNSNKTYTILKSDKFNKSVKEIAFTNAAQYFDELAQIRSAYSDLSFYTGHDVYPESAESQKLFLKNSFPFVSKNSEKNFPQMYDEVLADAVSLEEAIYKSAKNLLNSNNLTLSDSEKIKESIQTINQLSEKLKPYSEIKNSICVISTSTPFTFNPKTNFNSLSKLLSANILAISSSSTIAPIPFIIQLLLLSILSFIWYLLIVVTKKPALKKFILITVSVGFLFQFVLFQLTHFYTDLLFIQGFVFFLLGFYYIEMKFRRVYTTSVMLRYGVNLPQKILYDISTSNTFVLDDKQSFTAVLTLKFRNLDLFFEILTWEEFQELIQTIETVFVNSIETFNGIILTNESNTKSCAFAKKISAGSSHNAIRCTVVLETELDEISEKLKLTTGKELEFYCSISAGDCSLQQVQSSNYKKLNITGAPVTEGRLLLESAAVYKAKVVLSENVYQTLPLEKNCRLLDKVRFKKHNISTTLFQLLPKNDIRLQSESLEHFNRGRQLLYARKFIEAKEFFQTLYKINPDDKVTEYFLKRCIYFSKNNLPVKRIHDFNI